MLSLRIASHPICWQKLSLYDSIDRYLIPFHIPILIVCILSSEKGYIYTIYLTISYLTSLKLFYSLDILLFSVVRPRFIQSCHQMNKRIHRSTHLNLWPVTSGLLPFFNILFFQYSCLFTSIISFYEWNSNIYVPELESD